MALGGIQCGQHKNICVVRNRPYPVLVLDGIDGGDRLQGVQQINVGLYSPYDLLQDNHDLIPTHQNAFYSAAEADFRFELCVVLVPEIEDVGGLLGVL